IKVFLDVVYNHTGEGAAWGDGSFAKLFSYRGIDNAAYYQVAGNPSYYQDNSGCGGNFNCARKPVRDLILDSLTYLKDLGVVAFRFDLASILVNPLAKGDGFSFDKMPSETVLTRALRELPARGPAGGPGVDLIAEPWGIGMGTYQLGNFPYHSDR